MMNIKYLHNLHAHAVVAKFANIKIECFKNQSTLAAFNPYGGILLTSVLDELIHMIRYFSSFYTHAESH